MFWKVSGLKIPEIGAADDFDALFEGDLAIVFKHSSTCAISWTAHGEVSEFLERQPQAPVYLVPVRERREISRHVAERSGVEHASPQILVIRRGRVVADASHEAITAEFLAEAVRAS
ncbi:MAG: bacillithiol system redox-active protein YtxJ [Bryobacteraceae bacterium]